MMLQCLQVLFAQLLHLAQLSSPVDVEIIIHVINMVSHNQCNSLKMSAKPSICTSFPTVTENTAS